MPDYSEYLSPFTWRYGSTPMRSIWSEENRRKLWRQIWVDLARAQSGFGLVSAEQVAELDAHKNEINIPRALELEAELHHDLMAEVRVFAEQCPLAGGIIHLGATSMDIEDNADALRLRQALQLVLSRLGELLAEFGKRIEQYAALPIMAFTHLQPAEPTTLGYRLAFTAQDLLSAHRSLQNAFDSMLGKGFKGAVGTAASYQDLFGAEGFERFENQLSDALDLPFYPIASQTYPRIQDYTLLSSLAGLGAILYKFAFDLRLMQSPVIGEWAEPFGRRQVGSSAMPFKRNPINSEKIDSLARQLSVLPLTAWHNAAHSLLERTLDDSANRRSILPEAFLISDELLVVTTRLVRGLQVKEAAIQHNFAHYAPFAASEKVLMALVKAGADRQKMHEVLRAHAMQAWERSQAGQENPLAVLLSEDEHLLRFLDRDQILALMDVTGYTGIAETRSRAIAQRIRTQFPAPNA